MELLNYYDSVSVFQAKEADLEKDSTDEMLLYSFFDGKVNKVIVDAGEEVGMISLSDRYESLHIECIYILKKYRGADIGKKVIDHLKAVKNQYVMVYIDPPLTACPFTSEAEDFFLKQGFEPEGGDINEYYYLTFNIKK